MEKCERAELARLRTENDQLEKKVAQSEAAQEILGKAYELVERMPTSSYEELDVPVSLMSVRRSTRAGFTAKACSDRWGPIPDLGRVTVSCSQRTFYRIARSARLVGDQAETSVQPRKILSQNACCSCSRSRRAVVLGCHRTTWATVSRSIEALHRHRRVLTLSGRLENRISREDRSRRLDIHPGVGNPRRRRHCPRRQRCGDESWPIDDRTRVGSCVRLLFTPTDQ